MLLTFMASIQLTYIPGDAIESREHRVWPDKSCCVAAARNGATGPCHSTDSANALHTLHFQGRCAMYTLCVIGAEGLDCIRGALDWS